jgi:hypothetical protein
MYSFSSFLDRIATRRPRCVKLRVLFRIKTTSQGVEALGPQGVRRANIVGYLTDERRSGPGWIGVPTVEYILIRTLTVARALMMVITVAGLGLGTVAIAGTGCHEKAKKQKVDVVDCKRFCDKTFQTCGREVFIESGKLRVDKAKMFKVLGLLKKVKREGLEKCHKNCGEHQGVFRDAAEVNKCLEIEDCEKFAECITKYIK